MQMELQGVGLLFLLQHNALGVHLCYSVQGEYAYIFMAK